MSKDIIIGVISAVAVTLLTALISWSTDGGLARIIGAATQKDIAAVRLGMSVPSNLIAFFNRERCPDGWEEISSLAGRYVVGANADGATIGKTVGQALLPQENRWVSKHNHGIDDAGKHSHKLHAGGKHDHNFRAPRHYTSETGGHARAKDDGKDTTEEAGNHTHQLGDAGNHRHLIHDAGSIDGTNAPYIQLLACRKK